MDDKALFQWFGAHRQNPFTRAPEHIQPILVEFLEAIRTMRDNPDYLPGPSDRKTWIAGAHKLYNEFNHYKTGFVTWAIQKNAKNFPSTEYVKWPWSLRYLWERYKPEKPGRSFDDVIGESLDKDSRKFQRKSELFD